MADRIPIFPLHDPLLPTTDLGLHVFEDRYRALVAHSLNGSGRFGVVLIRFGGEVGGPTTLHRIGTVAQICGYAMLPDGRYLLELEGTSRFAIEESHESGPFPMATVRLMTEPIGNFAGARAARLEVSRLFHLYRSRRGDGDLPVNLPVDPVARSYVIASQLGVDVLEKQRLLEISSAEERLGAEREILLRELTLLDHLLSTRG